MKLYFGSSDEDKRIIANPKTKDEVSKEINKFCEDEGFIINYIRMWTNKNGLIVYDYGSHFNFFFLDLEN